MPREENWGSDSVSTISTSPTSPQPSLTCTERNIKHWDMIVFSINDPALAKKLNLTTNTELDIKVLDDPLKVAVVKQKALDFLRVPIATKAAIKIVDVDYAIICGTSSPTTQPSTLGPVLGHNATTGTTNATSAKS